MLHLTHIILKPNISIFSFQVRVKREKGNISIFLYSQFFTYRRGSLFSHTGWGRIANHWLKSLIKKPKNYKNAYLSIWKQTYGIPTHLIARKIISFFHVKSKKQYSKSDIFHHHKRSNSINLISQRSHELLSGRLHQRMPLLVHRYV